MNQRCTGTQPYQVAFTGNRGMWVAWFAASGAFAMLGMIIATHAGCSRICTEGHSTKVRCDSLIFCLIFRVYLFGTKQCPKLETLGELDK